MRTLILLPDRNSSGKKDFSHAFEPEAVSFAKLLRSNTSERCDVVQIDMSEGKLVRGMRFCQAISARAKPPLDCLAWFGHGLASGLPQVGLGLKDVDRIASVFASSKVPRQTVVLYACSTGGGGFADALRDALCMAGSVNCRVVAHTNAGHCCRNPNVRFFDGMGSAHGGAGGYYPVAPGSALWKRWVKALRETDLRFRMPFMEVKEIHEELAG